MFRRKGRDRDDSAEALLGVSEAARELGTSAGTLYRWIRQGFVSAEAAGAGEPTRVRLDANVRERFCEVPPEGSVLAPQARREPGLSHQSLWERIREGVLEARRIVRGTDTVLYVKWDREDRQLPLLRTSRRRARHEVAGREAEREPRGNDAMSSTARRREAIHFPNPLGSVDCGSSATAGEAPGRGCGADRDRPSAREAHETPPIPGRDECCMI